VRNGVLVLDFGSQYTQLIARRVRELKVYSEIRPYNTPTEEIRRISPGGIILSGGPATVREADAPLCDKEILDLGIPILGICYGMQLIAKIMGGNVGAASKREFGRAELETTRDSLLFKDLEMPMRVWMSHSDRILSPPHGFDAIAKTANSPVCAISDDERRIYAIQFHPEVSHTPMGRRLLANFLFNICNLTPSWSMSSFLDESISRIREQVGDERVLCALSGGVDSSVVAALLHKAVGEKLQAVFVDNGLLRLREAQRVKEIFIDQMGLNLEMVDASKEFLEDLKGITDPELKRKRIGHRFIRVFEERSKGLGHFKYLAQGTLYPDVIESVPVQGPSATIKSHHNVGGLPKEMEFELIEPLRSLFKDEVRELGELLGLPQKLILRHPFPGPGLAVRIVGEVTPRRLKILREADLVVEEEIEAGGLYNEVWQAFAVLLPVKSVGVMGDERTYDYAIAVRAVESRDGMTADWVQLPYELLSKISNRIINEVDGVNRVVYDISSKPPSTIEWE